MNADSTEFSVRHPNSFVTMHAVKLIFAILGVVFPAGCIYIPSTRQFQPNGDWRPEHYIGKVGDDKPIHLDGMPFTDAYSVLATRVCDRSDRSGYLGSWRVSPDGRRFAVSYQIVTGAWFSLVWFISVSEGWHVDEQSRYMILYIDADQRVKSHRTVKAVPDHWASDPERMLTIFDGRGRR